MSGSCAPVGGTPHLNPIAAAEEKGSGPPLQGEDEPAAADAELGHVRYVEDGCLIGYSEDLPAQYGRAATYVDRILKGTRPEDLPVQQGSVQLVVNAATARALGLKIPHSIRVQANVIKE